MSKKPVSINDCALYVIGGTELIGTIKAAGDVFVDGTVKGEISSGGRTFIDADSIIYADIHCKELSVSGEVNGNLEIKDSIAIKSTGKIVGNISCGELLIDEGAVYQGEVAINGKKN